MPGAAGAYKLAGWYAFWSARVLGCRVRADAGTAARLARHDAFCIQDVVRGFKRQMNEARGLKETSEPEYKEKFDRIRELRTLRDSYIDRIKEIKSSMAGIEVKSEAELEQRIRELEHSIVHEVRGVLIAHKLAWTPPVKQAMDNCTACCHHRLSLTRAYRCARRRRWWRRSPSSTRSAARSESLTGSAPHWTHWRRSAKR